MKLVSIPDLKVYLERSDDIQDTLLTQLVEVVSRRIETYLNRELVKQSRTAYYEAGRKNIFLPAYPIDLSAPFTVTNDTTLLTKDSDYYVRETDGQIDFYWIPEYYRPKQICVTWTGGFSESSISKVLGTDNNTYTCSISHLGKPCDKPIAGPDYEGYWTLTGTGGLTWVSGAQYYNHSFVSGIPDDLRFAALMQCSNSYRRRRDAGLSAISSPDGAKTFGIQQPTNFHPEVEHILKQYRKVACER